jgi:hypothetical protein
MRLTKLSRDDTCRYRNSDVSTHEVTRASRPHLSQNRYGSNPNTATLLAVPI